MATDLVNDLLAFRTFIDDQLDGGRAPLSLDEALVAWELANQSDAERHATHQAIRQGLDDVAAGRTRPVEEFDREFRGKHGLPPSRP
jgi:hypothetical protein